MSGKSVPKDAQVMAAILKDMGVTDYEPRIINAMLEFTYRYVTDVLDDAKVYSSHANKKNLDVDDIKLAIQCRLDHSLTTPPPRDLLMDLARHKDSTPLPLIKPYTGLKLPPDRYCLSALNYRLKTLRKSHAARVQMQGGKTFVSTLGGGPRINIHHPAGSSLIRQSGSMTPGQGTLTLVTKGGSQPKVTIRSAPTSSVTPSTPVPIIKFTPGSTSSVGASLMSPAITSVIAGKRKREDEDYDNP